MDHRQRVDNLKMTREEKHRVPPPVRTSGPKSIPKSIRPNSKYRIAKTTKSPSKPKRPPGRPFKMPIQWPTALSILTPRTPQPASTPAPRRLSLLESLPVEILEQIFLHSLELNLPRASPVIAAAVSRERIYNILITLALWDDNTEFPSSEPIKRIFHPLDYVGISIKDRAVLQQAIFRTRWCTMDRVREQIPTLMILTIHRQWINFGIKMSPDQQAALEQFLKRQDDMVLEFSGEGPPIEKINYPAEKLRLSANPGFHEYKLIIKPMVRIEIHSETLKQSVVRPAMSIIKFPDCLLRGRATGFTPEDVQYLEMLRMCSNNYADNETSRPFTTSWLLRRVLHEGVSKAICTRNLEALTCLLKLDEYFWRFHASRESQPECYLIPPEFFRAVTQVQFAKPCLQALFFETLVRASAESIPTRDPEILLWAHDQMRAAQKHQTAFSVITGRLVQWVVNFMLRLPEQKDYADNFPHGQLFRCGGLDDTDVEGRRFIDQVLWPDRPLLTNWMIESEFQVEGQWVKN